MLFTVFCLLFINGGIQSITAGAPEHSTVPLCCPATNWKLARISRGLFRYDDYTCIPPKEDSITQTLEAAIVPFEKSSPVYGYGIMAPKDHELNSTIPKCEGKNFVEHILDKDFEIPSLSCLMGIGEDRVAAISCITDYNTKLRAFSYIHKCCPNNYIYDSSQRKCVEASANFHLYRKLFKNAAIFNANNLACPRNKVLVEYQLNDFKFSIDNGQLFLRTLNKKFDFSEYCIEALTPITDGGDNQSNNPILRQEQQYLIRTCDDILPVCRRMPCIRRCCNDGEMFTKGNATSYCRRDESDTYFHSFESLEISGNFSKPSVFGILRSLDCLKYRLDPDAYSDEAHTISERDGSLYVMATKKHYTNGQYCVEKIRNSSWADQKLYTFLCFDSKVVGNDRIRFKVYTIGLLISCSFYAITLLVYLSIAKLRNLPGKILICLVSSLFTAYLGIALGQLMPTPNDTVCFASGFFIYFCLMAAFSWMNVMCFDIWQTFGSAKKKHGFKKNQTKRFLLYSLYGWGLPTLITAITVTLTKTEVLSENIRPNFGHGRCWFTYDSPGSANLLFFSGPIGLLFLINFILFILTLRYCNRVKREIFRMQSSNNEKPVLKRRFFVDKARFAMNTKLFVVMGITWFLELLSIVFYDHKKIFFWAISDSFNVLLGVFVFFIFVFKKRVWYSVLEKVGLRTSESMKNGPIGTGATHSTYTQNNISMTRLNAIDGNTTLLSPNAARRMPTM
ncbi:G-protein coupled receptor Mth2 [Lucilia sericata]|uniref:G-protein coupled receptor Mth2 n=1 Tax=Lucilia sericata TaxID=13632 RepID=UPI0018A86E2A|nr:G-protein coupled receptor Mth2 [Lucilia sericata]XP_037817402.1 G-protein coupled receptor Mth2 [Lucilia sericata]XP_037817404.1 G-protein coupled receptor Mth2 [Lucilia sericata]XP_037817405.1 G-protein coupled receptor Mth2 [Lucilia sericata]XP_037817406.1 G-protein coupled receptor Mth2 [Lucilia sericata]